MTARHRVVLVAWKPSKEVYPPFFIRSHVSGSHLTRRDRLWTYLLVVVVALAIGSFFLTFIVRLSEVQGLFDALGGGNHWQRHSGAILVSSAALLAFTEALRSFDRRLGRTSRWVDGNMLARQLLKVRLDVHDIRAPRACPDRHGIRSPEPAPEHR